jgi:hypothetical protein
VDAQKEAGYCARHMLADTANAIARQHVLPTLIIPSARRHACASPRFDVSTAGLHPPPSAADVMSTGGERERVQASRAVVGWGHEGEKEDQRLVVDLRGLGWGEGGSCGW